MRWSTPGTRIVERSNEGKPARKSPSAKMIAARRRIFR
jgi:hypothetical protein